MRLLGTLIFVFGFNFLFAQSIPNADFESWDFIGWNYNPTGWVTNNTQLTEDVFQDSASYEGELAMQVRPTIVTLGSEGLAKSTISIDYIPGSLDFYVKYERTWTAGLMVEIIFFNESQTVYSANWTPSDTASAWMPVSIILDQIEPIITHAEIRVSAFVGDFAPGDGWISVDDMSFDNANSIRENEPINVYVFPNPTADVLNVQLNSIESLIDMICIHDASGKMVYCSQMESTIDLSNLANGLYSIQFKAQGELLATKEFVVSK